MNYISVIIPEYNEHKQNIKTCINELLKQTVYPDEIIIVSYTPDSNLRNEEYDNVRRINTDVKGIGFARNYGVLVSSGKYIINMDIDAKFQEHDAIEKLIKPLELGIAKLTHCNAVLNPFEPRMFPYADLVYKIRNDLASNIIIPHIIEQGLCFRRSDYDILPEGFRNVPISEGGILAMEFSLAFGFPSVMKVEDVHVVTSARRINKLSEIGIIDAFNYDNAFR